MVLFEFARGDGGRAQRLYESYLDQGGPGRIDRRGDFSLLIAHLGHIGQRVCQLWLDPTLGDDERDRMAAQADEFVSDPMTIGVIDDLLDATRGRSS